jgi:hypothetical protein
VNLIPPAERRICVVVDIAKYSAHPTTDHLAMAPQLRKVTESAVVHAGVRWAKVEVQNQGDGLLLQLPPRINEPQVLPGLINGLCLALQQSNRRTLASRRLRLRMALTQGIQHRGPTGAIGDALIVACRLVDSQSVRDALDSHPDRDLAVIVSDNLYLDVIAQKYPGLDPAEFTAVQAEIESKSFAAKAWVHVPVPGDWPLAGPRLLDTPAARRIAALGRDAAGLPGAALGGIVGGVAWQHHQAAHPPRHVHDGSPADHAHPTDHGTPADHGLPGHPGDAHYGDDIPEVSEAHDSHHADGAYTHDVYSDDAASDDTGYGHGAGGSHSG